MSHPRSWAAGLSACLIAALSWPSAGLAREAPKAAPALGAWVNRALADSPMLQAAEAAVQTEEARLRGAGLPLYNPELEFEYERADIDVATLEYAQTVDWRDKRSARARSATVALSAARAQREALRALLAGELLGGLARCLASRRMTLLAKQRTELLERFRGLTLKRVAAGDVGQSEVQLARLSVAEAVMRHSTLGAALVEAELDLHRLTGRPCDSSLRLPESLPTQLSDEPTPEALAAAHPAVRAAQLRAQAARAEIRTRDRDRRADPTLALKGGAEDEDGLIGLRVVIPLHVRNSFRADVEVAQGEALQAEQEARNTHRETLGSIAAARHRYALLSVAWSVWQHEARGTIDERLKLLERLWAADEINTTEYLVQLQQSLDVQISGAELQGELWQAWLEWLGASGQIMAWLGET